MSGEFDAKALASRIYRSHTKQQSSSGSGPQLLGQRRVSDAANGPVSPKRMRPSMGSTLSGTASNALNSTLSTGLALDPASLATAPRSLQPFLGRAAAQMNGIAPSSQEYSATHAQRIGVASTSSQKRPLSMLLSARSERSMRGMSAAQKTGSSARRRLLPPSAAGAVGAVTDLDRAQTQDEYDAYLRSPFSFIDKVIENPFTEEFVYLRSADGPYDLEIVSHSQIDRNDYHTMSRAGVTHFYKGDTEFTALDQWEREYFLHTRMMEVNFFKKFRAWKAFYYWTKHIRLTKSTAAAKVLDSELFILNSRLRKSLIDLRTECVEATKWPVGKWDGKTTYSLDNFVAAQDVQRGKSAGLLADLNERVRTIVFDACVDDLHAFLVKNGFRDGSSEPKSNQTQEGEEETAHVSHAERAAHRTECRRLTKFIRLCDSLVLDTLVSMSLERATEMLKIVRTKSPEELEADRAAVIEHNAALVAAAGPTTAKHYRAPKLMPMPATPVALYVIELQLSVDGKSLQFSPHLAEFQMRMEQIIRDSVSTLMAPNRLLQDDSFADYLDNEDGDDDNAAEVDLANLVLQEDAFIATMDDIKSGLAEAFERVRQYALTFEKFKQMFLDDNLFDVNTHRGGLAKDFGVLLNRFASEIAEMDRMPAQQMIGLIQMNSANLKQILSPAPRRCLTAVQTMLPELAAEKCSSLLTLFKNSNDKVSGIPSTVEEFVEFSAALAKITEEQDSYEEQYIAVEDLYKLMTERKIAVTEDHKSQFERLASMRSTLQTSLSLSENSLSDNTARFTKELESEVPRLKKKIIATAKKLEEERFSQADADLDVIFEALDDIQFTIREMEANSKRFTYYQGVLQLELEQYEDLGTLKQDFDIKNSLWRSQREWDQITNQWLVDLFADIRTDDIARETQKYMKIISRAARRMGAENSVVLMLKDKVEKFHKAVPIVADLKNPTLEPRHWDEITTIIGYNVRENSETTTLGTLIELNVMRFQDDIATIAGKAVQEAELKKMLTKIAREWKDLAMPVMLYKEQKDNYVLGGLDDVIAKLDESLVAINIILGSRFVEPIRQDVTEWSRNLLLFQETMDEWMQCQKQWMYLESIFSAPDIQKQLPDDAAIFQAIDKSWRDMMRKTAENPFINQKWSQLPEMRDTLVSHNVNLDKLQKRLEDYLETKRSAFPRFYFLSNDELLEILAQTKNVQAVQRHLRKCFDNIVKLDFGNDPKVTDMIYAMISAEDESVPLPKNLKARGSIELWLSKVEAGMIESLRKFMKMGFQDYDKMARKVWVLEKFSQIVMTVSQIAWSRGCEEALRATSPKDAMRACLATQKAQLSELSAMVRGELTPVNRKKIVALITTDVHGRDVTQTLIAKGVTSINDFDWQQQLRFYWIADGPDEDCFVRQSNAMIRYAYEYMGVATRLVITPLTDRCWMTITGALHLKLGAAPAGPAGTGKTESTKDLAKAIGICCIVFNCSDQVDYRMMGKLFSGLCQAGAWCCLDEFNRIDIEVLSVIALQLLQIREARLQLADSFIFEERQIPLKPTCGVMITMNPGYAGRTELPDTIKVLFRPVSMMIPDYALIAEMMLYAEGFENAQLLSKKMVKMYKLASEQLSQQDHYDFGMRAVKSVLVMAGSLKRAEPGLTEDITLIRALRDSNVPKFLADDLPLFSAIISDLFPGVVIPSMDYGELLVTINQTCADMNIQSPEVFTTKIIQLYDTFMVRFGVMLVGPTGGGKSTIYTALQKAMTSLRQQGSKNDTFQVVETHVLNPKSIKMDELYGFVNTMTQEWTDGLASCIMRDALKDQTPTRHWIVFDGPVDALWIENMNTVLDDNMMLCLSNGERIKLKVEMRMLFEVQDLAVASPATVSRCGMVYVTPLVMGWRPFVTSWLAAFQPEKFPTEARTLLMKLFNSHMDDALKFRAKEGREPIPVTDITVTTSVCRLFEALFSPDRVNYSMPFVTELTPLMHMVFAFAFAWSFGGSLEPHSQAKLNDFLGKRFSDSKPPGSLFEYYIDFTDRKWKSWEDIVPAFTYVPSTPYFEILVPTIDTVRFSYLAETLLEINRSVFYTGQTGVGKSVVAADLFKRTTETKNFLPLMMTFSAQTASRRVQEQIEGSLEKKKRTLLGAPVNKRVVVFVDDVNMPAVETYGASPPIELLRQFQDYKGFYDRKKLFWKDIVDTTLMCCSAPPGGGRNELTPRFVRHFHVLCIPQPSDTVLGKIFGSILKSFLSALNFKRDVVDLCDGLVKSTVALYNGLSAELLPTPAKSHYTFNLRDISKVFQGVLGVRPAQCPNSDSMARLWLHEASRCFHDRLINDTDKAWFNTRIVKLLSDNVGMKLDADVVSRITWGDFLKPGADPRLYEEGKDTKSMQKLMDDYLDDFNGSSSNGMKLVFFDDAIRHVARITRIIRQPRGNAMLVGVGGSGKQSYTRLASSIAEMSWFQLEIIKGYGYDAFREDMKKIMTMAGVEGKQVLFYFPDNHIVDERFLEDVNNVLNAGEVPNLFESDERQKVLDGVVPAVRALGLPETPDVVWKTFVNRVRDNLHIVLTMSPVGDSFRVRCRMFPSLINCTTIDWFDKWPYDALLGVSSRFLAEVELPSPELRSALCEMCVEIHMSMDAMCDQFFQALRRRVYTTPKSYLDLIKLYIEILATRRKALNENRRRLETGLTKLRETNETVAQLQEKVREFQPKVLQKAADAEEMIKKVAIDQKEADATAVEVGADEQLVAKEAAVVREAQADAQKDLDAALPALANATKAVSGLEKSQISEMKALPNPPNGVRMVMEAICIMFKEKPDWDTAKKMLSNMGFLKSLQEFDKDAVFPIIKKLQPYLSNEAFTEEAMQKISIVAASLCKWVHAMVVYATISREVEPKKAKLKQMTKELKEKEDTLRQKQASLKAVLDKVAGLKKALEDTIADKNYWQAQMQTCQVQLVRASKLTVGLADEEIRWQRDSLLLGTQIQNLVGDAFLSAACISYYGAFTGAYRAQLTQLWVDGCRAKNIPVTDNFSLQGTLGDPVLIREWNLAGLPADSVSIDSALLREFGQRWPLFIDPQGQAKRWIRNDCAKQKLLITRFTDPNLLQFLRNAVNTGQPVLIEDIQESLDPSIETVLLKQTYMQGNMKAIRIGDQDVIWNDNFRLFFTTKLPNPHYLPETSIKVTIINFTVTREGLEEQLLGDVVRKEKPEIEEKKGRLVNNMAKDKKQLKSLEERILQTLSESKGSVLDNEELINTLDDSKRTSNVINERVKEAEITELEINAARERFRPAATRGSIMYFVIADLASIDPMYQFSLQYFSRLFSICVDTAPPSPDLDERIANIMEKVNTTIFFNICRGLFESHKQIYSFLIATSIQRHQGVIAEAEWNLFLRGPGLAPLEVDRPNPDESLINAGAWKTVQVMDESLPVFAGLCDSIVNDLRAWKAYINADEPHKLSLPGDWQDRLNIFQRMMILKTFRFEKIVFAVLDYVGATLGRVFQEPRPTALEEVYADIDKKTPVIFILSVGADPSGILFRFATEMKYRDRLRIISLGQGMGPKAARMIEAAGKAGDWVLLQNCHLGKSWLSELEKMIDEFQDGERGENLHENFRLWLTSMPVDYFPVPVLQNGVKLTNEPPKGLKANLKRSFASMTDETFESCTKARPYKKLLFGLCFFHAIIQERRKFGPLGWNTRYEFNDSDQETSSQVLRMFLEEQAQIPWDALRYVCGQINYGGRVTDDWDRRGLMTILSQFFTDKILDDDYVFSPSGVYRAPLEGSLNEIREYVDSLPLSDPPEIFGMHENANITFQTQETENILGTVLSIQPRTVSGGGGKSNDEVVAETAGRIVADLPALLDGEAFKEKATKEAAALGPNTAIDSLSIVLMQEIDRFNRLLRVVRRALVSLQAAIRGEVVMSLELDRVYLSLLNNSVPASWAKVAYPSLKPLASWVVDLSDRIRFMRAWAETGRPNTFWMSGFFFPQGFMTGALQNHARKYAIPIDSLNFTFTVQVGKYKPEHIEAPPADGIYVNGLFLDGARWDDDSKMLADSRLGQLYCDMPIIHFMPTTSTERQPGTYECPVYKTSVRAGVLSTTGQSTNFVLPVDLPTDKSPSYWVLKGAAMLCQLNN